VEYVEVTVGVAWMAIGVLMAYAALMNRKPVPFRLGAPMQVPMAMAGAGVWLVRTSVRVGRRSSKEAKASK
jgi:hypothetical protein